MIPSFLVASSCSLISLVCLTERLHYLDSYSQLLEVAANNLPYFAPCPLALLSFLSSCLTSSPISTRYVVLWARGVRHTIAAYHYNKSSSSNDGTDGFGGDSHSAPDDSSPEFGLRRDVGQLCALYALESVLAMGWGLSTLANWRLVGIYIWATCMLAYMILRGHTCGVIRYIPCF